MTCSRREVSGRGRNRSSPRDASAAPFIKTYEVVNAKTFRIVLNEPYGLLLDSLSKPSLAPLFMMPKKVAETPAADPIKPEQVIGSGPFIFKRDQWRPGEKVVYVKNTKYKPRAEPPSGLAGVLSGARAAARETLGDGTAKEAEAQRLHRWSE